MTDSKPNGPELSPYQAAMQALAQYDRALMLHLQQVGAVNPVEVYLILKKLVLEVTALRELVFETMSIDAEGNRQPQMHAGLQAMYCERLQLIAEGTTAGMQGPRLLVPGRH